jgi:myo-inositol-1(or 4)-monophosphatase
MIDPSEFLSICQEVVLVVEDEANGIPDFSLRHKNPRQVQTKTSIGDVITELDRQMELSLIRRLTNIVPGSRTIGEESGQHGSASINWVIDPIDGSTNVLHGMPHAAVSVALCEGATPRIGVVHNPFTKVTYYAVVGGGAFSYSRAAPVGEREVKRIQVSPNTQLAQSLLGFGLPYDRSKAQRIFSVAEKVFSECQDLRRRGSAALDIISVAIGELDGYFELDLRIWDVVAAGLILEESGGLLTSWDGRELMWETPEKKLAVLATNGSIHQNLQRIVLG